MGLVNFVSGNSECMGYETWKEKFSSRIASAGCDCFNPIATYGRIDDF